MHSPAYTCIHAHFRDFTCVHLRSFLLISLQLRLQFRRRSARRAAAGIRALARQPGACDDQGFSRASFKEKRPTTGRALGGACLQLSEVGTVSKNAPLFGDRAQNEIDAVSHSGAAAPHGTVRSYGDALTISPVGAGGGLNVEDVFTIH